jgi:hypothetical protein
MSTTVTGVVLRPFQGVEGRVRKGDRFGPGGQFGPLDKKRADYLESRKLFQPDVGGAVKVAAASKAGGGSTVADPTPAPRTGGRTGAAKPSSSSPAARAPAKSRSRKRAAAAG